MRHAHANWPNWNGTDFARPLTSRGLMEATLTGRQLRDQGLIPTLILASPAERTRQTANLLCEAFTRPNLQLTFEPRLYNASVTQLLEVIRGASGAHAHLMLVAHNPGVSELSSLLDGGPVRLETAEYFSRQLVSDTWRSLEIGAV